MKNKLLYIIGLLIVISITACTNQANTPSDISVTNNTAQVATRVTTNDEEIAQDKDEPNEVDGQNEQEATTNVDNEVSSDADISGEDHEEESNDILPEAHELEVPFYTQFPLTGPDKYKSPYQDYCEEASILTAYYYFAGIEADKQTYLDNLEEIKNLEDNMFEGGNKDTLLAQSLEVLQAFQGENKVVEGEIIEHPTLEDIKSAIAEGKLVIAPLYGKNLTNPSFLAGGPVYHNLVIKGYKDDIFIVNEVGITYGDSYEYKQSEIFENLHDFNPEVYPDVQKGTPRILILSSVDNK